MKTGFRVLSFIVSLCIVFSTLPLIFSATATETEPILPNRYGMIISKEGIDADFGLKYSDLASKTRITFSETLDLSGEENFEFDIYVEDYEILKSAIENTPGTQKQGIELFFSSSTNATLSLTRNNAHIDFTEQIKNDGWNHITVDKYDFELSATAINWGKIKFVFLKFSDNITNAHTDLAEKVVKLRNICTIMELPEISQGNTIIYSDLLKATLGENEESLYTETANRFRISEIENVNIEKNTYLGVDLKVSDFDKFNALLEDENIFAKLILLTVNGNVEVEFDSLRNGSKSGWYNIIAPIANEVTDDITGFYFELVNSDNSAKLGDAYSIAISIANVYAINMSAIEGNTLYGDVATDFEVDNLEFSTGKVYKDFSFSNLGEFEAINDSEYIEFDLYIEDYNAFKNSFEKDAENKEVSVDLELSISNSTDFKARTLTWSKVQEKIVYGGWNHIILPISNATNSDFANNETVKSYKLEIVGDDKENKTSYIQRIAILDNLYATKYITPATSNQYDTVSDLSVNGKQWNMGAAFSNSTIGEYHLENGVDFSNAMFVEFDIYIQNYDAWIAKMVEGNVKGITMSFSSTSTNDYTKDSRSVNFLSHITKSGWNHICLPFGDFQKGSTSGTLDISNITTYRLYFNGTTASSTGVLNGQFMSIANIGGSAIKVPQEYLGENEVLATLDNPSASGTFGDKYSLSLSTSTDVTKDFSKATYIEFDIYIEDYEKFVESFKTDANGKEVGVDLKFGIGMTTTYADSNGYYEWSGIQNKIKHSGWNHISLDIDSKSRSKGVAFDKNTIENIQCFKMWYGGDTYKNGDYQNLIGDNLVILANICAAKMFFPELPNNVLAQIGSSDSATLGGYFHDVEYRLFEEKLTAVDFSKGTAIEFDIYIDDYEALLAAEEASAMNYSNLERTRNSKLALYLSSTPAGLWAQYEKPRNYFSAYITISDKITHSGWNHVVIGKADFIAHKQVVDWSGITAWNVAFTAGSNVHKEVNPSPDVKVAVCNIVNTGVVSNVQKDDVKESLLDKNAIYVSDSEELSDDNGTWNPSAVYVSNDYKSEGNGSILLNLSYKSIVEDAVMYYLFDDTANMSDLKTLKFDFFIDLPQFIKASGNKAEILIGNHRNASDNYYKWDLDFKSLNSGWNSFAFDMNSAKKIGSPNLNEAKVIMLRFTEFGIDASVFAQIVIGIDNLRYVSSTGNNVLRVEGWDEQDDIISEETDPDSQITTEQENDFESEQNTNLNNNVIIHKQEHIINDVIVEETVNKEPLIITSDPEIKYSKKMKKLIYQDYLTMGIILGAEAILFAAAVIMFMIIYRKKKKKSI